MRSNRGLLTWGVFLVLVGAVPLAVRAGYLTEDQVRSVGRLWPLILIGVGVGILLARTRLAFLGGLLVAATVGLIVGGLLSGGVQAFGLGGCGPTAQTVAFSPVTGDLTAGSVSVDVQLNCGEVQVATGPGSTWRIEGADVNGTGPIVDATGESLAVHSRDSDGGLLGLLNERATWRITLPDEVRLDLGLELNAGSATVNLGAASVDVLSLEMNAGSAVLDLGSLDALGDLQIGINAGSLGLTLPNRSFTGSIEANAGSVALCAPAGAALRLNTADSLAAGYDYDGHGLVKSGSTWQTPGFDTAEIRIELDTQANAGSFRLDPAEGCDG